MIDLLNATIYNKAEKYKEKVLNRLQSSNVSPGHIPKYEQT